MQIGLIFIRENLWKIFFDVFLDSEVVYLLKNCYILEEGCGCEYDTEVIHPHTPTHKTTLTPPTPTPYSHIQDAFRIYRLYYSRIAIHIFYSFEIIYF